MEHPLSNKLKTVLHSLNTPNKIQQYVDKNIEYDPYREDRTIEEVVKDKKGECYNGALFALTALQNIGYKTGLLLLSPYEDEEHILAIYEENGRLGSIAQSKFLGLKGREPIYLNIHDLAISYKEFYFHFDGYYSLAGYSDLFEVDEYKEKWIYDRDTVVEMEKELLSSPIHDIMGSKEKVYVSPERYWKEIQHIPDGIIIPKRYMEYKERLKDI